MSDIFQEVDEDVRKERAEKFLKAYGKHIAVGVALIVLATAAGQYWFQRRADAARTAGARFQSAATLAAEGKGEDAAAAFNLLAQEGGAGYGVLARLREASAKAQANDLPGALVLYDKLAVDSSVPQVFRDLAGVGAALQVLDKGAPADAEKRAEPLTGAGNTFRYSAREVIALAALKAGDTDKARDRLTQLAGDESAPAGIRRRAGDLLATLGPRPAKGG